MPREPDADEWVDADEWIGADDARDLCGADGRTIGSDPCPEEREAGR